MLDFLALGLVEEPESAENTRFLQLGLLGEFGSLAYPKKLGAAWFRSLGLLRELPMTALGCRTAAVALLPRPRRSAVLLCQCCCACDAMLRLLPYWHYDAAAAVPLLLLLCWCCHTDAAVPVLLCQYLLLQRCCL